MQRRRDGLIKQTLEVEDLVHLVHQILQVYRSRPVFNLSVEKRVDGGLDDVLAEISDDATDREENAS